MTLRIAIAQFNFTVGDIAGNVSKIIAAYRRAMEEEADMVILPEMCITGYPPEDLVLRHSFQDVAMSAAEELAQSVNSGTALLCGGLWREGEKLYNTAFLMEGGKIIHRQYKHNLPNYGVFDEKRVFVAANVPSPALWRGMKLGILICEDMWSIDAAHALKIQGAELLLSINASPYETTKHAMRLKTARAAVGDTELPLIYVNQTGGQDELVFDGSSFVMNKNGELTALLKRFAEDFTVVTDPEVYGRMEAQKSVEEDIYNAMVMGLRDYVEKNCFPGVLLGLSGGIDSALTAAVAVDALGATHVHALMLPSPYTSQESLDDAAECARLLGIRFDTVPISPAMPVIGSMLSVLFAGKATDITEENIQSRLRGLTLMALSNKFGSMLLTTGNKSEMAAGYATLYGDMCGGFNVLKDLYKTEVYRVSHWRNGQGRVIPERILTKAPSAELRPNQTDQDSLPPYELLDAILQLLIEQRLSVSEIAEQGHERAVVEKVAKLLYRSEYKRRQAAPGVKITRMAFGRDRRYPLTSGWMT